MFAENDSKVINNEYETNYNELGEVTSERLRGSLSYYSFSIGDKYGDQKQCNSSCSDFLDEYYDMKWYQVDIHQNDTSSE